MKSSARLLKMFREYNRRYFGNRLIEPTVRFETLRSCKGSAPIGQLRRSSTMEYRVVGRKWTLIRGRPIIVISRELRKRNWEVLARITLLHEMAHMAISWRFRHGPRFQNEMLRLAKAGAFRGLW